MTEITRWAPSTGKTTTCPVRERPTSERNGSISPASSKLTDCTSPRTRLRAKTLSVWVESLMPRVSSASGRPRVSAPKAPSASNCSRLTRKSTARSTDSEMMCIRLSASVAEISPERRSPNTRRRRPRPPQPPLLRDAHPTMPQVHHHDGRRLSRRRRTRLVDAQPLDPGDLVVQRFAQLLREGGVGGDALQREPLGRVLGHLPAGVRGVPPRLEPHE